MPQVPNNVKFGVPLLVVSFVVFALLLWGGDELIQSKPSAGGGEVVNGGGGGGGGGGGPTSVTIVAKNLQFSPRSITASAGQPLTVTLDNQDAGVLHNIAFFTNRSASVPLTSDSKVEIFAGVAQKTFTFTPPRAGTFYFHCDVHPDMNGSLIVK
jgi:plastocyanin